LAKRTDKNRRLLQIVAAAILEDTGGSDAEDFISHTTALKALDAALSDDVNLPLNKRMHICGTALFLLVTGQLDDIEMADPFSYGGGNIATIIEAAAGGNPLKRRAKYKQDV
jgi:hypothetical protein